MTARDRGLGGSWLRRRFARPGRSARILLGRPFMRLPTLALALASTAVLTSAQTPSPRPDVPTFGASSELVYVRFHVEKKGSYLGTLAKEQLRVLEDGRPQEIALLETPSTRQRTIPPEVTLMLDVSSSVMDAKLLDEALVKEVLFASLSEQARVGLCAFGGSLRCLRPPTRDADDLLAGFQEAMEFGWQTRRSGTRLYASVAEVCRQPGERGKAQRALVIFSDGIDNQHGDVDDAIKAASEGDVRIYAIKLSQAFRENALNSGPFGAPPNRALYDYKKLRLDDLAAATGGRAYEPRTLDGKALAKILREIGNEISMENVVGYPPPGAAAGRKRKVKVELVDKSLGSIPDGERTVVR
jgi:VWFA-related protein